MTEERICPGCGRHCDLSDPHCGRGVIYAQTGQLPERRPDHDHHSEGRQGEGRPDHDHHGEGRQGEGRPDHDHHGEGCRGEGRPDHDHHGEGCRGEGRPQREVPPYRDLDTDDRLIDALRDLSHIMREQYEGRASQQRILMLLNSAGPMTQRDLTGQLGIQPGSASEILSKLERGGRILRTPNEADRRTIDVRLTEKGRALAQEAVEARHTRHQEMFACLTDGEKETLLSLLEKVEEDWASRYRGGRGPHGRGGRDHGPHDHGPREGKPHDHDSHDHDHRGRDGRRGGDGDGRG